MNTVNTYLAAFSPAHWLVITAILPCLLLVLILRRQQRRHTRQLEELAAHQHNQLGKLRDYLQQQQQHNHLIQQQQDALLRQELHQAIARFGEHTENRLQHGIDHSQHTFRHIIVRLATIDEAQKRIDQLAGGLQHIQHILADKRSRGTFGETQLKTLIDNILPAQHVHYQYTLRNGRRPDCCISLPGESGKLCIDAKFPLESYRALLDAPADDKAAHKRFRTDLQKHIHDIANRYITPPETAESAILFLPSEAVFAELHARHGGLIEEAQRLRVWITSPTTLAALLTSAHTLIKNDTTHRHARDIRDQLQALKKDFEEFQSSMDALARHIEQSSRDIHGAQNAARRLSRRFADIDSLNNPENSQKDEKQ